MSALRLLPLALGAMLLLSCNALDKGTRDIVSYYTLFESIPSADRDTRSVGVETIGAPSYIDNLQLMRRKSDDAPAFELYPEHHRWGALPREMATELALEHLRAHFSRADSYPGELPDLVFRARITRFEEVRADGATTGKAVVRLEGYWVTFDRKKGVERPGEHWIVTGEAPTSHPGGGYDCANVAIALRKALLAALELARDKLP